MSKYFYLFLYFLNPMNTYYISSTVLLSLPLKVVTLSFGNLRQVSRLNFMPLLLGKACHACVSHHSTKTWLPLVAKKMTFNFGTWKMLNTLYLKQKMYVQPIKITLFFVLAVMF